MNIESFFFALYPLVPVIAISAYIPQILNLVSGRSCPMSFTLMSWSMWLAASTIGTGYAVFCVSDVLLSITAGCNVVAQSSIIAIVCHKRRKMAGSVSVQTQALLNRA